MPHLCETVQCTGCTACASICPRSAITMEPDEFGFLYPTVNPDTCVACGLCERVCPALNGQRVDRLPEAYAAYAIDAALRLQSSSGGIFSLLALEILRRGGVVYGAAYDDSFSVRHICVETEEELAGLRGAKYAQSALDGIFRDVKLRLEAGQHVLFSGTPCQVAGLKAFLRRDCANLICVDFVCHSVPSPKAWSAYVRHRAQQDHGGSLPSSINLRDKTTGWSRYRYSNRFNYPNGAAHSVISGQSLYMKLFTGNYINRESCAGCQFKGYSRVSDLTLGDFWGIWNIAPEMDDDMGTSLVLIQSEKGKKLWEHISNRVTARAVTVEEASRENQAMIRASQAKENRAEVLRQVCDGNFAFAQAQFPPPEKENILRRLKHKIKRMLFE